MRFPAIGAPEETMLRRLAVCLVPLILAACQGVAPDGIAVVDTHIHFWDIDEPHGIGWPPEGHPLHRTIMPRHYDAIAERNNVRGVVVVQSGSRLYENGWTLKATASRSDRYVGVVGNLSGLIGTDRFEETFTRLCEDPRYVGFRLSGKPLGDRFFNETVWRHLKMVADRGRTLDFLMVGHFTLEDVRRIARRLPGLKMILNHGGGIKVTGARPEAAWVEDLKKTAAFPDVYCKVSGLFDKAATRPAPKDVEYYRPNLDVLWEAFGEDRLVFGSDWPVTQLDGSLDEYKAMILAYFAPKGRDVCEKVFSRNALRFYSPPGMKP